jgi:DNA-binding response OmpR family regulator
MATILWVEDQNHWIEKFKPILEQTDFDGAENEVLTYKLASAARQQITLMPKESPPDIAILDAHMNGNSGAGFSVSRTLHAKWPDIPIIYLSEHSGTQIEQTALESMQAKDFIAKHQRNIEEVLCWRIKAVLRQQQVSADTPSDVLNSGDLKIDLTTWEVYWHNHKLMNPSNPRRPLAPMPRKILYHLVKSSPRPISTEQMADFLEVDPERFSYANYRQHIKTLRHAFNNTGQSKGNFIEQCKIGVGIVTFGDLGAYCWKLDPQH